MNKMELRVGRFLTLLVFIFSLTLESIAQQSPSPVQRPKSQGKSVFHKADTARVLEAYERLPLRFESNQGQSDSLVQFLARGRGYDLYLTPTEAILGIKAPSSSGENEFGETERVQTIKMSLIGANPHPEVAGTDALPGTINYLVGNEPTKWRTHIHAFAKV